PRGEFPVWGGPPGLPPCFRAARRLESRRKGRSPAPPDFLTGRAGSSAPPMKITATIITLDEERNITRAIESLRCADEILIVDSGSVDRTVELAEKLGVRVIEAGWRGYSGQKNWAAEQASHDWILSLDADEALSEALEAEIWNLKKKGAQADAYT